MAGLWESQRLETGILAPHLMLFLQYHAIYHLTLNSGPYLWVLQIRAFRRFDDCYKLITQLGQAGHLTQLDLRFFIDDLGQRFQICWAHRILLLTSLFSGIHWSKTGVGPGGLEWWHRQKLRAIDHDLGWALGCPCCWNRTSVPSFVWQPLAVVKF